MPVDNTLYDQLAGTWWDAGGFLHVLKGLNPARFGYMRRVLLETLGLNPVSLRALDVGCGGGILAEEFARLGCSVTGVDPSERSLAAARAHAAGMRLDIDYRQASGESLPFADASFDVVYCCDVLEHVRDLDRVIAETSRVLKPMGVYLYDTINRTWESHLVMIKLFQEWSFTSFMPNDLHDWKQFIKPAELVELFGRHGLESRDQRGLGASANPLRVLLTLRRRKRGALSFKETIERIGLRESRNMSVMFIGHAVKARPFGLT